MRSAGLSDAGRERENNEDRLLVAPLQERGRPPHGYLFVVADGVGGARGGDVASTLAVESIQRAWLAPLRDLALRGAAADQVAEALRGMVAEADRRIVGHASKRRPDLSGMATTLVAALCFGGRLVVANVGDSRCYRLRGGTLKPLSHDQNVTSEMLRQGLIDAEAVARHPLRNVLTDYVGGGASKLHAEIGEHELRDGDVVLLCSDGLTDMVDEPTIATTLASERDPARACERLVAIANERGGHDNVTAIVARAGALA
jgi:protein phosphatase